MSDAAPRSGPIQSTPEGGPLDVGAPASTPGAGQVQATPEAGPLDADRTLTPPAWREHMRGPIPGLDDVPPAPAPAAASSSPPGPEPAPPPPQSASSPGGQEAMADDDEPSEELRKWPPYTGKPVSEVGWQEIGRMAAPIASQAEKLAIKGIDLSARGLTKLARYLESRRDQR